MKHIKIYESYKEPEIGDYVICSDSDGIVSNFTKNTIGKIVRIDLFDNDSDIENNYPYQVLYNNIPENIIMDFHYGRRWFSREEIKHLSKDKEELEIYIATKRYNL